MMRSHSGVFGTLGNGVIGGYLLVTVLMTQNSVASEPGVYKVEEDWEMVITQPDPITTSPQITFFTSPSVHSERTYFQLQMNYAADDSFSGGGFHVAAVKNDDIRDEARSETKRALSTDGEPVRWTSVMASIHGKFTTWILLMS